jgi:hypothetical protein
MDQSAACCVKLIMAVALRFGQVAETTLHEVLLNAVKRAGRTIRWTRPDWPVVCQMQLGARFPLKETAPADQPDQSLKQIALAAGILGRVTAHAVKRGAARDMAYRKKAVGSVADNAVQLVMHHAAATHRGGGTQDYAGSFEMTAYNLPAEAPFDDRKGPRFAASGYEPKRVETADVDAFIEKHNLDKSNASDRSKAAKQIRKQNITEWDESQRNRPATLSNDAAFPTLQLTKLSKDVGQGQTVIFPHGPKKMKILGQHNPEILSERSKNAVNAAQGRRAKKESGVKVLLNNDAVDIPIDSQLLELDKPLDENKDEVDDTEFGALKSIIFGDNDTAETLDTETPAWDTDELEDALVDAQLGEPAQAPRPLEADAFLSWITSINVCKFASFKDGYPIRRRHPKGIAETPPTRFQFRCGIGQCTFQFVGNT